MRSDSQNDMPSTRGTSASVSGIGRVAATGGLILALVAVALIVLENRSSYTVHADFQNASGLVTGNVVLMGPAKVGTVDSIGLTRDGAAEVTMSLDSDAAPLHQGTVARIYENSLSGIASKYVVLEPGPTECAADQQRRHDRRGPTRTPIVSLDQLFDTLDPLTRAGLRGFIRGEAASMKGHGESPTRRSSTSPPACQTRAR